MEVERSDLYVDTFLLQEARETLIPIAKQDDTTRAWFATMKGKEKFVKWFSASLHKRAATEIGISGKRLHPAIIPLERIVQCEDGTLLLYPRVTGITLSALEQRQRFYALPTAEKCKALLTIFDAWAAICDAGWVLRDVYEGNVMYDFDTRKVYVYDFDLCERGTTYRLEMERNYGSSRLMAPEEWGIGNQIDQRTNVFNLARIAQLAFSDSHVANLVPIFAKATAPDPNNRYSTVQEFVTVFQPVALANQDDTTQS
jgi:serine/threonine-protein kinase